MDISVIVPIYNVESYILECLQSVAAQTKTKNVECILVDDCGTDNSVKVAEQFISAYEGDISFALLHHPENEGLSAARNTGIKNARGKYLFFLDSDDMIKPYCLDELFALAETYQADMVQGAYESDLANMKRFEDSPLPEFSENKSFIKRTLLNYDVNPVMAQNRLVRKQLVVENNLWFKESIIHEDLYWSFFLAKVVERICFCKQKTYFYRSTPGSITNKINIEKEAFAFHTIIEDFCLHIDAFERNAQKRLVFCILLGAIDSRYYQFENDRRYMIDCLRNKDTHMNRVLLTMIFSMKASFIRLKFINLLMKIYLKGGKQ